MGNVSAEDNVKPGTLVTCRCDKANWRTVDGKVFGFRELVSANSFKGGRLIEQTEIGIVLDYCVRLERTALGDCIYIPVLFGEDVLILNQVDLKYVNEI